MPEIQTPVVGQDAIAPVEQREVQPMDWDSAHEKLRELALGEKGLEVMSDNAEFANSIRAHVPSFQEYRAYHVLSPNTLPSCSSHFKEEDLPGEYAVLSFVQRMQEKYGSRI